MIRVDEIDALLSQTATKRLRFENIINELLDEGLLTKSELVIRPERTSAYNFERDVRDITDRSDDRNETRWQVGIPRDGFYDTLPERLFHRAKKRTKDEDEWAEIRQQEEKQEQESRHFFLPFDNEFNHQKVKIAQFETRTVAGDDDLLLVELLRVMAPHVAVDALTPAQKLTLFLIIVGAWQTVGNWERTAECFSQFLGVPVGIRYGRQVAGTSQPSSADYWQPVKLGSGRLGVDFVLPQPPDVDFGGLIRLTIGPLTDAQLTHYLPGGTSLRHVSLLADYLLPAEADWRMNVLTDEMTGGFCLLNTGTSGRLGLTTTLT